MRLREGLRRNPRCDVSVLARIMEDYAFLCIYASRRNARYSADPGVANRAVRVAAYRSTGLACRWMDTLAARFLAYRPCVPLEISVDHERGPVRRPADPRC